MHSKSKKGTVRPRTGHENPGGKQCYGSTLSFTSALDGVRWLPPRTGRFNPLSPGKRPGIQRTVGWMGLRACLDGCGKLAPTDNRSPDRPVRSESLYQLRYPGPRQTQIRELRKYTNHTSLIKNYVVPCICLMVVMTYAWFDVTSNAKNHAYAITTIRHIHGTT